MTGTNRNQQARVHVVDDDPAMRDSIRFLLESVGLPVVCFDSAESFLSACDQDVRGCVILDVRMPGMSGMQLHARLRERDFRIPVIIVTAHSDVPMAVAAMRSGAFDLIEKPFSDQVLIDRVREALEHDAEEHRAILAESDIRAHLESLSPREREVMDFVVGGCLNKQIATKLDLSIKTVEVHRSRVMQKMEARSLADLVRMAMRVGIEGRGD
ncbi:MAG: response regulator transcription factor [Planctomycetota bacterium]